MQALSSFLRIPMTPIRSILPRSAVLALFLGAGLAAQALAAPVLLEVNRTTFAQVNAPDGVTEDLERLDRPSLGFLSDTARAAIIGQGASVATTTFESTLDTTGVFGNGTFSLELQPDFFGIAGTFIDMHFSLDEATELSAVINNLGASGRSTVIKLLSVEPTGAVELANFRPRDTDRLEFSRLLDPGNYFFLAAANLSGTGVSTQGFFDYAIAFQALPSGPPHSVPEPRTLGMVLLALGVGGLVGARRRGPVGNGAFPQAVRAARRPPAPWQASKAARWAAAVLSAALGAATLPAAAADTAPPAAAADDRLAPARALIAQERWRDAIAALKEVNDSGSADWNNLMGYSHRKAKVPDLSAAEAYYNAALRLDPRHRGALAYSGELYLMRGELPRAEERLAALDKICTFGCDELRQLRQAVASYKANGRRDGARP
jgi:tetratricopeptide (TPR) repeat protein